MAESVMDARRMAHAVIVSSPSAEEGLRQARRLAAAAVCAQGGAEGCGQCRDCRKALAGIHPDVLLVGRLADDKGRRKREIGVDQIRAMSADAAVLPNEARRKVYIIDEADSMNLPAQNAALKLLEEPPAGAVFLLCVTNPGRLLPTVRSRCAELTLTGPEAAGEEEAARLAEEYLQALAKGDPARLALWCARNEGLDAASAGAFFACVADRAADLLRGRASQPGFDRAALMRVAALAERCRRYLRVNVGVKLLFGLLAADSLPGGGNRG